MISKQIFNMEIMWVVWIDFLNLENKNKKKIQDTIKYGKHDVFYNPHVHYILNT